METHKETHKAFSPLLSCVFHCHPLPTPQEKTGRKISDPPQSFFGFCDLRKCYSLLTVP
jgi:hypothetical protein